MIRKPFNFGVGIFCGITFVLNILAAGEKPNLLLACLAVINIMIGLVG